MTYDKASFLAGLRTALSLGRPPVEPPDPTSSTYLTFSSISDFTLSVADNAKHWQGTLEYSTDTDSWSEWDGTAAISSVDGNLYLRGTGNRTITGTSSRQWVLSGRYGTGIEVSGNIESILDYQTVAAGEHPAMGNGAFYQLFYNCTLLTAAPDLMASAATASCYYQMFYGCTTLVNPPIIAATTMDRMSCRGMFSGCLSLTEAPELLSTSLQENCYSSMFYNCRSLSRMRTSNVLYPNGILPAETLDRSCYSSMFYGCSSLEYAPEIKGKYYNQYCCQAMFRDCSSLKKCPILYMKTVSDSCCYQMFYNCKEMTVQAEMILPALTLAPSCYEYMFQKCSKLGIFGDSVGIAATTVATRSCAYMFAGCSSLIRVARLHATTLGDNCYQYMYSGCSSLEIFTSTLGTEPFRIPTSGTGVNGYNSLYNMFANIMPSAWTVPATPRINTTYYCSATPVG